MISVMDCWLPYHASDFGGWLLVVARLRYVPLFNISLGFVQGELMGELGPLPYIGGTSHSKRVRLLFLSVATEYTRVYGRKVVYGHENGLIRGCYQLDGRAFQATLLISTHRWLSGTSILVITIWARHLVCFRAFLGSNPFNYWHSSQEQWSDSCGLVIWHP
jgi:hypothetical protein